MASGSEDVRRLREALAGLVADDVPELLAEARTEARARVRAVLAEVMAEAMLEQVRRSGRPGPPAPTRPDVPSRVSPSPAGHEDSLGYYLYGVTTSDGAAPPDMGGVDPAHPVSVLMGADLAALVSRVPLAEFNEERLREHLGDIAWVETIARRHEEVLEAAAARGTLIPMRLCSIYRDAGGVHAMLEREAEPMRAALHLVQGRAEWAVKVFNAPRPASSAPSPDQAQPDSGAAYLERRRQAQHHREAADEQQAAACESVHSRLGNLAARAAVIPPQRPEVSGHDGEMLLNGVYLVDDAAVSTFQDEVRVLQEEFAPAGVELVITGPWPAYNFVPDAIGVPA
ncbi:MAG: hypothetical protein QOF83_3534 [Solirubrobacteraceae bacterium]|nr:hypothetical protein [Solirubrobacteraceae bacterium]